MIKKKIKIGIDVDGVLRDFDAKVMEIVKKLYPDKILSEYTTSWDYVNVDIDIKELSKLWRETHCEEIYREAPLISNTKEELKLLKEWGRTQSPGYQYAIVTAQMPYNANHTYYWLGKHHFNFLEMYISNYKHKIDVDILIDDSPKNYEKWVDAGRDESSYILFDRSYNQEVPATNRIYKLSDLIEILKNKKS
jgi:5'(3')-deoxyribonucleotidase